MKTDSIFDFDDYKSFVNHRISLRPKGGHGEFRRMAHQLGVHTTMISHVFRGDKHLSPEQAFDACAFLGLTASESKYFLCLVNYQKAGTERLRSHFRMELEALRRQAADVSNRVSSEKKLSEADRQLYYSKWIYSALRLATAITGLNNITALAERFRLPKSKVSEAMEFLLRTGMCRKVGGKLTYGPKNTHLEKSSPFVTRHHVNWRLKAMESFESLEEDELVFTSPVVIEKKHAEKIKRSLLDAIDQAAKTMDESGSEELFCLNIDWVRVR